MIKKLSRYKKQIALFLCTLLALSGSVCSFSFESKASSLEFDVSYAEPATSDTQGYINLLFKNDSTGDYMIWTYFWYCAAEKNGVISPCYAVIDLEPRSFSFSVGGVGSATSAYYNLNAIYALGQFGNIKASGTSAYSRTFSGWTIVGCKYAGNVGEFNSTIGETEFVIHYSADASAVLLQDIFNVLNETAGVHADIYNVVYDIYNSVDSVEGKLDSVVTYLKSVDSKLSSISTQLSSIYSRAGEILAEEKEQTTWLEKIWNSIQEFFAPEAEDKETTDQFKEDSSVQSDKMNELNQQNKTDKVDVGSASSDVDANIDFESVGNYGGVLAVITENEYILQMMLVVVAISLVAYVLFGKK